jgi:hypothetical protein
MADPKGWEFKESSIVKEVAAEVKSVEDKTGGEIAALRTEIKRVKEKLIANGYTLRHQKSRRYFIYKSGTTGEDA